MLKLRNRRIIDDLYKDQVGFIKVDQERQALIITGTKEVVCQPLRIDMYVPEEVNETLIKGVKGESKNTRRKITM